MPACQVSLLALAGSMLSDPSAVSEVQRPIVQLEVRRDSIEWTDSVTTRAVVWTPIGLGGRALPTLLFSPGFGQTPSRYATLLSEWARQGYLVIGIAHPSFPNPDQVELFDASAAIARHLTRAVDHILRHRRSGSPFWRVDPERLGVIGHSVGGSAVAQACAWDPRLRAGMDLDGTVFGEVVHTGMRQPFFLLRQRFPVAPNDRPQFFERRDQASLHEDSVFTHATTMYWLTVERLDHMAFTDAALTKAAANDGHLSAERTHEITTRYVLDFFGHYLSGMPRSTGLDHSLFAGTDLRIKR